MTGRILIVETTAPDRLMLRDVLEGAHYTAEFAPDLAEALNRLQSEPRDLFVLDVSENAQAALALCAALRGTSETATLPILALARAPTSEERLSALRAGADDVLDKAGDPSFLLARVRSLLRVRDPAAGITIREGAARAFGMAEATQSFVPAGRTTIVSADPASLPRSLSDLAQRLPGSARVIAIGDDLSPGGAETDLFIIDQSQAGEGASVFRTIADIQSRAATWRAKTLVVLPESASLLKEMVLDLGADDLVTDATATEEVAFRVRALLRRKTLFDRRRDQMRSGIEAALTDPLTGLRNRRYAMAELRNLLDTRLHGGQDFSLALLDIDYFKSVNDTWGHAAGDVVLKKISEILLQNLRATDLVARIGGEEFLVVLPHTQADHAQAVAERLRRVVEAHPVALGASAADHVVRVTISAGVATTTALPPATGPQHQVTDDLAQILEAADRALYAAKASGRNRVDLARPKSAA